MSFLKIVLYWVTWGMADNLRVCCYSLAAVPRQLLFAVRCGCLSQLIFPVVGPTTVCPNGGNRKSFQKEIHSNNEGENSFLMMQERTLKLKSAKDACCLKIT